MPVMFRRQSRICWSSWPTHGAQTPDRPRRAGRCEPDRLRLRERTMNDLERIDPKPTCVRYGVMGYICALAFILYIDRICIGGRHVGALFGLGNMIGLAGGALSQVFLGSYADYRKALGLMGRDQRDPAFYFYGGVLVVGGLLWLFINPAKPVVPVRESAGFSRKPR
jgi:hypothetical protein